MELLRSGMISIAEKKDRHTFKRKSKVYSLICHSNFLSRTMMMVLQLIAVVAATVVIQWVPFTYQAILPKSKGGSATVSKGKEPMYSNFLRGPKLLPHYSEGLKESEGNLDDLYAETSTVVADEFETAAIKRKQRLLALAEDNDEDLDVTPCSPVGSRLIFRIESEEALRSTDQHSWLVFKQSRVWFHIVCGLSQCDHWLHLWSFQPVGNNNQNQDRWSTKVSSSISLVLVITGIDAVYFCFIAAAHNIWHFYCHWCCIQFRVLAECFECKMVDSIKQSWSESPTVNTSLFIHCHQVDDCPHVVLSTKFRGVFDTRTVPSGVRGIVE